MEPFVIIGAILALIAVLTAMEKFVWEPKRRQRAAHEDERRKSDAIGRGWRFDTERLPQSVVHRYDGVTDGVSWTCKAGSWTRGTARNRQEKVFTLWNTAAARLEEGILVIWPAFGSPDQPNLDFNVPQFVLDLFLTPLITALGGDDLLRQQIREAQRIESGELQGSFILRATDQAAMARFLDAGARAALLDAAMWLPTRDGHNLVIAVVWRGGVSILLRGFVADLDRIERVSKFGAAIARAAG